MNDVFGPYLRKFILVFFDDILVYSRNRVDHLAHLRMALKILWSHTLNAKISKCTFEGREIEYLGHVISGEGVKIEHTKVATMLEWPIPKNVKSLMNFLGLTRYYRKFVRHYGSIMTPLTESLRKDAFVWTEEATRAFENLKQVVA